MIILEDVCMCAYVHVHVEVGGQLVESALLPPLCGFWKSSASHQELY